MYARVLISLVGPLGIVITAFGQTCAAPLNPPFQRAPRLHRLPGLSGFLPASVFSTHINQYA